MQVQPLESLYQPMPLRPCTHACDPVSMLLSDTPTTNQLGSMGIQIYFAYFAAIPES